jgi:hypothetical protein
LREAMKPECDEVVICHLTDALDALAATSSGLIPNYTRSDNIVNGTVWGKKTTSN